jgi:hypothetical protein
MTSWTNFYVIIGSAGAALIGIQFVVVTLVANMRPRPPADSLSAFGTPTVVHFTSALLVAAVMSAPWPSLFSTSMALAICGLAGLGYCGLTIRRTLLQTYYTPVWQDWLWYTSFPCTAYAVLVLAALFLRARTHIALFLIAAAALGLLLIGIHNSWDSITHLVTGGAGNTDSAGNADNADNADREATTSE